MQGHGKIALTSAVAKQRFPGPWAGGISLIVSPLLLLAGILLRSPYHFFFPDQLAAYGEHPLQITVSYSLFGAGIVMLWPAVLLLVQSIGVSKPLWAFWGGIFTIAGLFARTFHAGVDHLAFQLVRTGGVDQAVNTVGDAYGAFHIYSTFNLAIISGWIVLAIGCYRSGTLGLVQSAALSLTCALPLGVLKGTTPWSIAAAGGLAVALIPFGWTMLRSTPFPGWLKIGTWSLIVCAGLFLFTLFGRLG
ncbi:hypothetical protein [Paenibacillus sp. XY044]|uniref:hypothetical protein n=1 Tax=Paenibacillus sp. XY044 TaxID=2026089 RepID=UPI000B997E88|nr:hypothetical protein [Paenibacillus sp. XY044]OZB98494.1 hypothetical protein CJP46_04910 [Paenibacillus sp. XY044]